MEERYTTNDLYLASTLSLWFPIDGFDKTEKHKIKFFFLPHVDIEKIVTAYWGGMLEVDPHALLMKFKEIKIRMYDS